VIRSDSLKELRVSCCRSEFKLALLVEKPEHRNLQGFRIIFSESSDTGASCYSPLSSPKDASLRDWTGL
jgi:hypothetical protein